MGGHSKTIQYSQIEEQSRNSRNMKIMPNMVVAFSPVLLESMFFELCTTCMSVFVTAFGPFIFV